LESKSSELAKFGTVGALAYAVDVGGTNVMWMLLGQDEGHLTGKAVAAVLATTFAYFANRHWTYRDRERTGLIREYGLFVVANGVGIALSLLCLAFTVYVLGLDSMLAKNIAGNVVGVAVGTVFRFWSYRQWIFLRPQSQ
jgi:putative flippase GtrA